MHNRRTEYFETKQKIPVYVIYVTWNDRSLNIIYRRYSRFFELQTKLLDKFPDESGTKDPTRRIIPFLPGKIMFGRSHIREVALKRLKSINQYCMTLIKLPSHISECDEVLAFFETSPDDLLQHSKTIERKPSERKAKQISHPLLLDQYMAIADYDKKGRNEVSLCTGTRVEVVEKTEIGWWFVSTDEGQGWVPSSHLEKEDGEEEDRVVHEASPGEEERFVVIETYIPMAADEIRIDKGGFVQVLERNLDGWWLVRYQGNEGRVPATNLTKTDTLKMTRVTSHLTSAPVEVIPNLMSISSFNRRKLDRLVDSANHSPLDKPPNQTSPTKPLIDLNFESQQSVASGSRDRSASDVSQGIDENFNPLLRNSRRKNPPPRRSSVSTVAPPRPPAPPPVESVYVAVADFTVTVEDGVCLHRGQVVSVLEKTETGWWYVSVGGEKGWAPVSYINKRKQPKKAKSTSPRGPIHIPPHNDGDPTSLCTAQSTERTGTSSLAAVLKAGQQQSVKAGSSYNANSEQLKVDEPQVSTISEQIYANIEDADSICEVGRYVAAHPFEGIEVGEVRLSVGDLLDVLGRNVSGWWYVRVLEGCSGQGEGWVPRSFLRTADEVDEDATVTCSGHDGGIRGRLIEGVYEEVNNPLYNENAWSDSTNTSCTGPSHARNANQAIHTTTATVGHDHGVEEVSKIETAQRVIANPPLLQAGKTSEAEASGNDGLSDVERLNNFVRSSFKGMGPRPTLPLKKSKEAENSQQKLALEAKPNVTPFPKLAQWQQCEESRGMQRTIKPPSVKTFVTPVKPVNKKPIDEFKHSLNSSSGGKPTLPVKKFSNPQQSKPGSLTLVKPGLGGTKPVPGMKPTSVKLGMKPPVPRAKPLVHATKPTIPQNKPLESRGNNSTAHTTAQSRSQFPTKSGVKLGWQPDQQAENRNMWDAPRQQLPHRNNATNPRLGQSPPLTSSSGSKSSKVQDLAKLFGQ